MEEDRLLELALQNKSKKSAFTFLKMLNEMELEEIDELWVHLYQLILEKWDNIPENNAPQNVISNLSKVIQAVIDIAQAMLEEGMSLPEGFLLVVISLNGTLFSIPNLDSLKNNFSGLCEKIFSLNYTDKGELFTFNTVLYLLKRSTSSRATKRDVKRVYSLRALLPKIITLEVLNKAEVWKLLENCAVSNIYLTLVEGQKMISLALTLDVWHVINIHNVIKKKLPSCSVVQLTCYGKAYFEAWLHASKSKAARLLNEIEITCVQDLMLVAIKDRHKTKVFSAQRVLTQFNVKKKETDVLKMLHSLYYPILWQYLMNPDGLVRANAAQLFLNAFPLEDPDLDIVRSDNQLNQQMLMIKDLLLDDYPIVRTRTTIGLCLTMSLHWEIFPEEMLKTFFKILTEDLSCDSSSSDVRCAVAKGFKVILQNPLTVPTMRNVLPKIKHLFHDISSTVRIAFCHLLMTVKKIYGIKYFDIVPLNHLLARMEGDTVVTKLIVNLIHNSYFPKAEHPTAWLIRCVKLIQMNGEASKKFFQYVPLYIGVDTGAKFMIHTVKTIHFYMKSKTNSSKLNKSSKKESPIDDSDTLAEAIGLDDFNVVQGLLDGVAILWFSCNLSKQENKSQLKMVVGNFSKWIEDLIIYYENTPVWTSVYYLASIMPPEYVPNLSSLCLKRLKCGDGNEDYPTLMHCLCNQHKGDSLLITLKDWVDLEFASPNVTKSTSKKRKTGVSTFDKSMLGIQLLDNLLNEGPCQKIVITQHSKELKSFLQLFHDLKLKTEGLHNSTINTNQATFIMKLLFALMKISVLLHAEENFNGIKVVEDILIWVQNQLWKLVWPNNNVTLRTRRSSSMQTIKISCTFKKLVLNINKGLCVFLSDMTSAGYFNTKRYKFMMFGMQLLNLDSSSLLEVSKLLVNHTWSGALLYREEKQDCALSIVPDCLSKIEVFLKDQDFIASTPACDLKEIHLNVEEAIKILNKYSGFSYKIQI